MCTVIVSFEPDSPTPVLLVGVRDEFMERPWVGPGHHWPQWPELSGGQDLQAGGTWLAVNEAVPRVACVLNGIGEPAAIRRSRGELPLLAARGLAIEGTGYDPYHLVVASPQEGWMSTWDGAELTRQELGPGLHFIVNSGLEGALGFPDQRGREDMLRRIAHFRPRLASVPRPDPIKDDWADWLPIVDGDGLDPLDPRAIVLRRDLGDGHFWGTSSVSLVALGRDAHRYDFIDKSR
jgi:uncharacterized protein with NRDE domain